MYCRIISISKTWGIDTISQVLPQWGILRDSKLSNAMNFLQIRFGHLKLASVTPGLSNSCKLRFKSNIAGIYKIDIYCVVEDTPDLIGIIFVRLPWCITSVSPSSKVLISQCLFFSLFTPFYDYTRIVTGSSYIFWWFSLSSRNAGRNISYYSPALTLFKYRRQDDTSFDGGFYAIYYTQQYVS